MCHIRIGVNHFLMRREHIVYTTSMNHKFINTWGREKGGSGDAWLKYLDCLVVLTLSYKCRDGPIM